MMTCAHALQEGDVSLSGSIEWEDFLAMMRPVVVEEYRRDAEAMLADTSPALREATEVHISTFPAATPRWWSMNNGLTESHLVPAECIYIYIYAYSVPKSVGFPQL